MNSNAAFLEPAEMLGAAVAAEVLVARTSETACLVRHVAATPHGMSFIFVVRLKEPIFSAADEERLDALWRQIEGLLSALKGRCDDDLQFHVEFSDGREFWPPRGRSRPRDVVVLAHQGSGGDPIQHEIKYWLGALPPPEGNVSFVCSWGARGISESRGELSSAAVVAAADLAIPFFAR